MGPSRSGVAALMGGPVVLGGLGVSAVMRRSLRLFVAGEPCGRVGEGCYRLSEGARWQLRLFPSSCAIEPRFLPLPPWTRGTTEVSQRAFSAAPTASAQAPRSALA